MALLPIIIAPDPRLKVTAKAVERVDDDVRRLMDDMLETMHSANGIGLAAPQVGDHRRVIVVDVANEDEDPKPLCMANPELVWVSDEDRLQDNRVLLGVPNLVRTRFLGRARNRPSRDQGVFTPAAFARNGQHEVDRTRRQPNVIWHALFTETTEQNCDYPTVFGE